MRIELPLPASAEAHRVLFGPNDANLRLLRAEFGVKIVPRGTMLLIDGPDDAARDASLLLQRLVPLVEEGRGSVAKELANFMEMASVEEGDGEALRTECRRIEAKTPGQRAYVQQMRDHDLVFAVGPAGTGKTYLAVAAAAEALRTGLVKRLILTRPAVEAGENLGFLPGDMRDKVDPYLRPIYDALGEMLTRKRLAHYIETEVIEVAPLAFMRGRTLSRAFVILDEAQNTSPVQMKMLLTRLGPHSKCVVTGDMTQVDLRDDRASGLVHAVSVLEAVPGVAVARLDRGDIVRHRLVADIVHAYDQDEALKGALEPSRDREAAPPVSPAIPGAALPSPADQDSTDPRETTPDAAPSPTPQPATDAPRPSASTLGALMSGHGTTSGRPAYDPAVGEAAIGRAEER